MSEWVVHFTDSAEVLQLILGQRTIRASGPFGWAKNITETSANHMSACFSEIPLDHLARLCERHGRWGLGFTKHFIAHAGGNRVWYVERDAAVGTVLFDAIGEVLRAQDLASPLLQLTPFIDGMADGVPYAYRFDWEREWRVPGGLHFEFTDVAFVLTPEGEDGPRPAGDLRLLPSASVEQFAVHAVAMLGDDLDQQTAVFLAEFTNPANELPYSTADGGYQWFVQEWDTEEAVSAVFDGSVDEKTYCELVSALDDMSRSWVSLGQLRRVQE
jgi:Putative abortive phage resistance protein AbiGi, antitoxin